MLGLTPMSRSVNRLEISQDAFGGYDHSYGSGDGTIWDMRNLCSDRYPLLTSRPRRYLWQRIKEPNGFFVRDCICWVDGPELYVDDVKVGEVTDSPKRIVGIQDKLIILPDKMIYDRGTGKLKQMDVLWSGEVTFCDGSYAGETAAANTIQADGVDWAEWFRAGDAVTVQIGEVGVDVTGDPKGPYVIREIDYDEETGVGALRFYENTWEDYVTAVDSSGSDDGMTGFPSVGQKHYVTITRSMPELELIFEHGNRLWGCKGSTIYASKLGDPTNWNVFDGLSTDSYTLTVGSPGSFTAGCSYGGRPLLFKEDRILKIYGDTPESWQTYETESLGVEAGSADSLAVAGETLFYKSKAGIMAYTGSYPSSVADAFGQVRYRNAVAGSDGTKYYVSMEDVDNGYSHLFVYDTRYGLWHREDPLQAVAWGRKENLMVLDTQGRIWLTGDARNVFEGCECETVMTSFVEFADWCDGSSRKKGVEKLRLRLWVEAGTEVKILIQYDSGAWELKRTVAGDDKKQSFVVPLRLKRCDHYRIRLEGQGLGTWTLYEIMRDRYTGSDRK